MKNILLAACFCIPNHMTKKYLDHQEYFWGSRTTYTCEYSCDNGKIKKNILGTHHRTIFGSEQGNEIVCEGTVYEERYSTVTNWFYWEYQYSRQFSGAKSKAPELQKFCAE